MNILNYAYTKLLIMGTKAPSFDGISNAQISEVESFLNKILQLINYAKNWITIIIVLGGCVIMLKDIGQLQAVGKESPEGQQIQKNLMYKVGYMVIAACIPQVIPAIFSFFM